MRRTRIIKSIDREVLRDLSFCIGEMEHYVSQIILQSVSLLFFLFFGVFIAQIVFLPSKSLISNHKSYACVVRMSQDFPKFR